MFKGILTALVTPFRNNVLDEEALRRLVDRQIREGCHGLVVCGTTGEAAAMTVEEQLQTIRVVLEEVRGRVPVIAGTGSNNTQKTVEITEEVAGLNVDGVLVVTPYYVKPTQEGLTEHYRQVAKAKVPIVVYNVPGRTGVSLSAQTVGELSRIPGVEAIKEASGDMKFDSAILCQVDEGFSVLSGDDFTTLPLLAIGGKGSISVVSNVVPKAMVCLYEAAVSGKWEQARQIHLRLLPLMEALFWESNPIPVKAVMAHLGYCSPEIRLPMTQLSKGLQSKLETTLGNFEKELG